MSLTSVSSLGTDPLAAFIDRELSGEDHAFAMQFAQFWQKSDLDKDFVIDLDDVHQLLGFSVKGSAKRTVVSILEKDLHYTVTAGDSEGQGGHNKEVIRMTVQGFKRLCMSIKTEKATAVRASFMALQDALFTFNKEALEAERCEKDALRAKYDDHVRNTERVLKRRFANAEKGDVTYIYKDSRDPKDIIYNVGKTINLPRRAQEYSTHNYAGDMIFTKRCLNSNILEKAAHHMLDQFRVVRAREWFKGPEDVIKDTLETAESVLDGYVDRCENLFAAGVGAKIRELILSVPRDDERPEPVPDYVISDKKAAEEKESRLKAINSPKPETPLPDVAPRVEVNPGDFDAFIAERCEIREDAYTLPMDLAGAHRLWARFSDENIKAGLYKYLREKFPRSKRAYDDGSQRMAHIGVALKPMPTAIPEPSEESTDIQLFMHAECKEDYTGRVGITAFLDRFSAWKRAVGGDPEYQLLTLDKRRVEEYLSEHYMRGTPHTDGSPEIGYFGLMFKDDIVKAGFGKAKNANLRKRIMVLNPETQPATVMKVFESMQECATWFNTIPSTISTDISHNRMRKGLLIKKVTPDDEELIKKYDPKTSPDAPPGPPRVKVPGTGQWKNKAVEEIDAKTGKVVQVFETVKAAADDASVEPARMSTIISKGRKLGNFYYRFVKPEDEAGPST
jgi:hypothetical protein